MKIAFLHTQKSFLPELGAYIKHLDGRGHSACVVSSEEEIFEIQHNLDLIFRFGGLLRKINNFGIPEVHNYNSSSTGRWPMSKNLIKSFTSKIPNGRIFLNETVKNQFHFLDSKPFIYRDMGVDEAFFCARKSVIKKYDLTYCGSITGRPGLLKLIYLLCAKGFTIGLAGNISNSEYSLIDGIKNLDFVGPLAYDAVPEFISLGRFGLNFCPNMYPFNIQTSTKAIEYLAAGIGIVSNKYQWIDSHSAKYGYKYIDLNNVNTPDDLIFQKNLAIEVNVAREFEWDALLLKSGFSNFLAKFCV